MPRAGAQLSDSVQHSPHMDKTQCLVPSTIKVFFFNNLKKTDMVAPVCNLSIWGAEAKEYIEGSGTAWTTVE